MNSVIDPFGIDPTGGMVLTDNAQDRTPSYTLSLTPTANSYTSLLPYPGTYNPHRGSYSRTFPPRVSPYVRSYYLPYQPPATARPPCRQSCGRQNGPPCRQSCGGQNRSFQNGYQWPSFNTQSLGKRGDVKKKVVD